MWRSTRQPLARYTVAQLGGPADALLAANSTTDLTEAVTLACQAGIPWIILGGGTNVLISDAGYRGLVIINQTKGVRFENGGRVVAESGASLSTLARRCMNQGLAGLEWAVNVPGTVGGAVVNNAGAHGGAMAELGALDRGLHRARPAPHRVVVRRADALRVRNSVLKGQSGCQVVLAVTLALEPGHDPEALNARASAFVAHRKRTQPGATLGNIFKNPPGDYAGRPIEAAGLERHGAWRRGISSVHANFIVNKGEGTARDYRALIEQARGGARSSAWTWSRRSSSSGRGTEGGNRGSPGLCRGYNRGLRLT